MKSAGYVTLSLILGLSAGSGFALAEPSSSSHSSARTLMDEADARAIAHLEAISEGFARIAESAKQSVVNVSSVSAQRRLNRELKRLFPDENLRLQPMVGTGSGVIIDPEGYIVTNNHVISDANAVEVTLWDGRKLRAQVIGADPMTDVAVIKIAAGGLKAAVFGDSDKVRVGHLVLAIGSPFRLGHSVSHGIISGMGRSDDIDVSIDYKNWLQTDAPINPGNSGGPLINTRGEIIGINVAIATDSGGHQGVGFAIPSNTVRRISSILKTGEKVVRGYLGVQIQSVDEKMASAYGLREVTGVMIGGVGERTPASRGGLKAEDIVLAIDGESIRSREHLQEIIADTKPGEEVAMDIWRKGSARTLKVKIEEQPKGFSTSGSIREMGRPGAEEETEANPSDFADEPASGTGRTKGSSASDDDEEYNKSTEFSPLGFDAETLSPDLIKKFKVDSVKDGVLITRVEIGSEAYMCGLRRGLVIVKANDKAVHNAAELKKILTKQALSKGVRLKIGYLGQDYYMVLRIR